MQPRVAIIGGGIAGLATANRIRERAPGVDLLLLESSSRLGGVLRTTQQEGFLIEAAADNFLTSSSGAVDLCRRLGLEKALIEPDAVRRQALVVHRGHLQPIPAGFQVLAPSRLWPLLSTPILSWQGKLRAGWEYFLPRRTGGEDESLESFVCRRFGRELFNRLVQPLVGSIYTGDPRLLSIEATLPRFAQMERDYGSLIRAMLRKWREHSRDQSSGARYGQFVALRNGMSSLIEAIAARLPAESVQVDSIVDFIVPGDGHRWLIGVGGSQPRKLTVDGVVLAIPAPQAARLLDCITPLASRELRQIEYSSCAVVSLGYRRDQIGHSLNGFGFVVPLVENRLILSCSFSSIKYAGRAPQDAVLLRVFIGGACQSGLLDIPREQLIELARREVEDLLQIHGEPVLRNIVRQPRSMPQYYVGHQARVKRIDEQIAPFPTLALAGAALYGVGVPSCIQSGEAAADRILPRLQKSTRRQHQVACI